jgi:hypothetical protein
MFSRPVVTVNEVVILLNIDFVPANQLINALVKHGILKEATGFSRNRIFILNRYVDIFVPKT